LRARRRNRNGRPIGALIVALHDPIAELQAEKTPIVHRHPLCGGVPPALAWLGLHLFEEEVLPALETAN
jgi:hypothetical protein